ncbi:hypothetical protein ACFP67_08235 [Mammaliicoccus sciuri]|uniref:hypothetical protein n=1 Tax=Mammaliicoccus sciuri TaxID=1296 RepID=UPI0021560971|nr:hypothetical protein [Mammaliicoccus sciuri]
MKRLIGISILNCILLVGCGNSTLDKDYLNIAHRGASGSKQNIHMHLMIKP